VTIADSQQPAANIQNLFIVFFVFVLVY